MQGSRKVGAGGAKAPPIFGRSANPISPRGDTLPPPSTTSPPKISDLATALSCIRIVSVSEIYQDLPFKGENVDYLESKVIKNHFFQSKPRVFFILALKDFNIGKSKET